MLLMRTLLILYARDFQYSDSCRPLPVKSRVSECRAYHLLASVCSCWQYALKGWPESPTSKWVQHRLKKLIEGQLFIFTWVVNKHNSVGQFIIGHDWGSVWVRSLIWMDKASFRASQIWLRFEINRVKDQSTWSKSYDLKLRFLSKS